MISPSSRALVDTSVFVAREAGRPLKVESIPEELAVSVITIGELRAGVHTAANLVIRDRRLKTFTDAMAFRPVPIDMNVAYAWATLRALMREHGRRMPVNDSWIAATAMSLGVPVVTQDDDYSNVPGLVVISV